MPKGIKCPKDIIPKATKCLKEQNAQRKNLKYSIFNVIILKIKREKILKKYLGFDLVIFYSLKFRLIIISQCFFLWNEQTIYLKVWVCDVPGMDFLGFGMAPAFIYQASCRPSLFMLCRFFPSIKYNYIFAFFIFLLGNKFGQKSANFGQDVSTTVGGTISFVYI